MYNLKIIIMRQTQEAKMSGITSAALSKQLNNYELYDNDMIMMTNIFNNIKHT